MVESIVDADPTTVDATRGELQAITAASAGWTDPRAAIQATIDVMARTAMIEVAGRPSGTGFLVGDDLVLTAAHVLDRRNWPPSPRPGQVQAVFDYMFVGPQPSRKRDAGGRGQVCDRQPADSRAEADGVVGADWDAPADRLDFALLKLATPVPDPPPDAAVRAAVRGHYQLQSVQDDYNFGACTSYMIMQHPLGDFLKLSPFDGSPVLSLGGTRMRYGGNTLAGASGSPVVDSRGRLVGLHHYFGGGNNQGVPIAVIARALLNGAYAGLFQSGGPVAAAASSDAGGPVRDEFVPAAAPVRQPPEPPRDHAQDGRTVGWHAHPCHQRRERRRGLVLVSAHVPRRRPIETRAHIEDRLAGRAAGGKDRPAVPTTKVSALSGSAPRSP